MKQCAVFLIILIFSTIGLAGYKLFNSLSHPVKYQNLITEISKSYNLNSSVVASLINVESSYNKQAKSNKNAIGLMQIKLETANYMAELNNKKSVTETELFLPQINIEFGCMYLALIFLLYIRNQFLKFLILLVTI